MPVIDFLENADIDPDKKERMLEWRIRNEPVRGKLFTASDDDHVDSRIDDERKRLVAPFMTPKAQDAAIATTIANFSGYGNGVPPVDTTPLMPALPIEDITAGIQADYENGYSYREQVAVRPRFVFVPDKVVEQLAVLATREVERSLIVRLLHKIPMVFPLREDHRPLSDRPVVERMETTKEGTRALVRKIRRWFKLGGK